MKIFEVGAENAYLRTREASPDKVPGNQLLALQGALLDLEWNDLPHDIKADLLEEGEKRDY